MNHVTDFQERVIEHFQRETQIPELTLEALRLYVNKRIPTGGFLRACLVNDFVLAVCAADDPRAAALTSAIQDGDVDRLRQLLGDDPQLATARLVDRHGVSRTPLHIVADWPTATVLTDANLQLTFQTTVGFERTATGTIVPLYE